MASDWTEWVPKSTLDLILRLMAAADGNMIFRGQEDADWQLEPTISRVMKRSGANRDERLLYEAEAALQFSTLAPMFLQAWEMPFLNTMGSVLMVMRHYGAPTRLLDWTDSPWVACFFAACEMPKVDGAIWAVRRPDITENLSVVERSYFHDLENSERVLYDWLPLARQGIEAVDQLHPTRANDRIHRQQATFLLSGTLDKPQDELISARFPDAERLRWRIPKEMKRDLMIQLKTMNVDATTLFSGIDGVGRSVRHQLEWNLGSRFVTPSSCRRGSRDQTGDSDGSV